MVKHRLVSVFFISGIFIKVSWEISLLSFFSWNLILFWQKEPIKVPNARLSPSPNFHFTRLLLMKYIKFQLKKYRGVTSDDTEEWCKIWKKTKLLFWKWQEFGEFWSELWRVSKSALWLAPFVQSIRLS